MTKLARWVILYGVFLIFSGATGFLTLVFTWRAAALMVRDRSRLL